MKKTEYQSSVFTIANFLSAVECFNYIKMSENIGYEEAAITTREGAVIVKDIRNNDRVIFDDVDLANYLYTRIKPFLPKELEEWELVGLNERFRFYRYTPEQYFKWHQDGYYCRNNKEISALTFLMYLNDDYHGGETSFTWDAIKPERGMALLFPHQLLHQGAPVKSGVKYVLRTDVMYHNRD